jgi:HEAT repeat protein
MLDDPDPAVRARALRTYASGLSARAVGSANDQEAFAFRRVIHALDDPIAEVREAATEMLHKRRAYNSPLLMAWANERLTRVALHDKFRLAFKTLGAAGNNAAIPALKQLGRHDNALVRGRATDALHAIGTPEATLALEEIRAWEQEYYKRQINENRR